MGSVEVASTSPGHTSSTYLVRSVFGGFAAIFLLICMAAGLTFEGIEHIHAEASHSLQSLQDEDLTHTNVDQLIAAQSRRLLGRVELILGICELSAIGCGAFTIWTVRSNLRRIQVQSNELNLLSWRMSQEHEVVARRFSHEIHDEFGQMLTGLRMMLQHASAEDFEKRRPECLALIDDAIGNVRELSQLLRPVILDDFGLDEALQWMARRLEDQTRIRITYTSQFHGRLPEAVETQLFRIAQECLANMIRHSKANEAEMHLSSISDWVSLSVSDNGVGFPRFGEVPSPRKGMGLVGMKARIRHLGGIMRVENHRGGGASLFFSVPLAKAATRPIWSLSMPSAPTRVLLADDHALVRRGLALILETDPMMQLVGEAQDGNETLALVATLKPDVVIMDISMTGMNGIECTRILADRNPGTKVIILSMHRDPVYVREVLRVGAKGYLVKEDTEENLLSAIRNVAKGNAFLSPAVAGVIVTDFRKHISNPLDLLTTREREVLYLIAEGLTNKEVAKRLGLSVYTIEAHRSRVMEKLNLQSSVDLVRFAIRHGLIV